MEFPMDFSHLLITLGFAVLVMIFGNIFKNTQEEKRRIPPRGGDDASRRPRAPAEVDRILEEIHRRQRQAAERRLVVNPQAATGSSGRARSQTTRTASTPRRVRRAEPVQQRRGPQVVMVEERKGQPTVAAPVEAVVTLAEAVSPTSAPVPIATPRAKAIPPGLATVTALLRSGKAVPTAILLQEIFGPPLCRRRHHRDQ
jgi:hypothetical protein